MATTIQYASTPRIGAATLTTGDTSRTAPTTVATVLTGGSSGTRVDQIDAVGLATTVSSGLRLFLHDGTTYTLLREFPVQPVTASAGTVWELHVNTNTDPAVFPIILPNASWSLRMTVNDTQTGIRVTARGGDF